MLKAGLATLLLCAAAPAFAVSAVSSEIVEVAHHGDGAFSFTQQGFGGATVTGSFSGHDANGDGQLSSLDGEIADFALDFTGDGEIAALAFRFDDLIALVYDLDYRLGDGLVGDVEGIAAFAIGGAFYMSGANSYRPCDGETCGVIEDGARLVVPAPAPLALLVPAAGLLALRRRARR